MVKDPPSYAATLQGSSGEGLIHIISLKVVSDVRLCHKDTDQGERM